MVKQRVAGRSLRTPVKHWILKAALGKITGVLALDSSKVPCKITSQQPLICVDLCGGDGLKTDMHDASPMIIYEHCERLTAQGKSAAMVVYERSSNTFDELKRNCQYMSPGIVTLICGDSREYRLPRLTDTQAAFIHCDPNTIDQIPLTGPFVSGFNKFTTYLVTLGCNVSGLKMLKPEKRSVWFEYVDLLKDVLPHHHDVILFWLNRDSAQWAYLLSMPKVWSGKFAERAVKVTSKEWTKGVSAISLRSDARGFNDQIAKLFLTEREYDSL